MHEADLAAVVRGWRSCCRWWFRRRWSRRCCSVWLASSSSSLLLLLSSRGWCRAAVWGASVALSRAASTIYRCSLLIGSPRSVTDKLQRVLNAPARVITSTKNTKVGYHGHYITTFTGWMLLSGFSSEWLQQFMCLHGMAPAYLTELCTPVAASASRRGGLRSSTTSDLVTPRCRLSTYGSRAFSVAGPVCWNVLPDYLKSPDISFNCFRQQLKTFLFCRHWQLLALYSISALETVQMRHRNPYLILMSTDRMDDRTQKL